MLLSTLGTNLLGNLLRVGEGTIRADQDFWCHPILQKYYQNKPQVNDVYSINNLPKIKDEAHVINLNQSKSIGTHWITLYVNVNNRKASYDAIYFDSFGVEHIPKEIKEPIGNKIIITNIYRIQAYDSIMYRYWMLDVDRTASHKITLDYLSVCPSFCPSLSFLNIGSLVPCDTVQDDSWP